MRGRKRKRKIYLNFIFLHSIENRLALRYTDLPGVFLYNSEVIFRKGNAQCGMFSKEKKALASLKLPRLVTPSLCLIN